MIIGTVLLIWYVLGDTPIELYISLPFVFFIISKIWSMNENLIKLNYNFRYLLKDYTLFKENVKNSFINIKKDISDLKKR